MPEYTTNLDLLKKIPESDGSDYFNIQTMLNDNWDKLDAAVAAKETPSGAQAKVDNLAGAGRTTQTVKGNADAIAALNQTGISHSAEEATTAAKGHVQLATNAEVTTGTNTTKAVTPAGVKTELDKKVNNSLATAANQFLLSTGIGAWAVKTATEIRNALGLGNTTGALPIANGGTGATTAAGILTAAGVTATAAELNILDGVTGLTAAELTNLGGITATAAEINILGGVTGVTASEVSYLANVTSDIQTQLNSKADNAPVPVNTTASRTLALTDAGTYIHCNSSSAITLTIPANATVAIPVNAEIAIGRWGTGVVSIAPASGVILQSTGGKRSIKNQYETAVLKKLGTDIWLLVGSLSA